MVACEPVSLGAAFIVGIAGSAHCIAMCGGLSSAFAVRAAILPTSPRTAPSRTAPSRTAPSRMAPSSCTRSSPRAVLLAPQGGRITSYVLAGALVGASSNLLVQFFDLERLALLARAASGIVLLAVAATLLTRWRPLGALERAGGRMGRLLAPLARRITLPGLRGSWLLGMLWGFLPCGFLYTMLLYAALRGSAAQAALMLVCFGLGTLPALLGANWLSAHLPRLLPRLPLPRLAGWALLGCSAWTLLGPFLARAHH